MLALLFCLTKLRMFLVSDCHPILLSGIKCWTSESPLHCILMVVSDLLEQLLISCHDNKTPFNLSCKEFSLLVWKVHFRCAGPFSNLCLLLLCYVYKLSITLCFQFVIIWFHHKCYLKILSFHMLGVSAGGDWFPHFPYSFSSIFSLPLSTSSHSSCKRALILHIRFIHALS